jgi:DNA-binding MarR family transcriptional regulator
MAEPKTPLPPFAALRAFHAAAVKGRFRDAADSLGITESAISHQVRRLEDFLRVALFDRSGSGVRLTAAGRRYLEEIDPAIRQIQAATEALLRPGGRTIVRLTMPPSLAASWVTLRCATVSGVFRPKPSPRWPSKICHRDRGKPARRGPRSHKAHRGCRRMRREAAPRLCRAEQQVCQPTDAVGAVLAHQRRRRPAPLLDARGDGGDLSIGVGPCIFCVWDQPIDRPPLDLVGRPRPLIFIADSRACARPRRDGGSVGAFTRRPTRSRPRSASRH